MFAMRFVVKQNMVTARGHAQIMRDLNRGILERWEHRYLPLHFKGGATERYGYRRRSAKYNAWKGKRFGHTIPLRLTGGTEAAVKSKVKITATQNRARLVTKGRNFDRGLGGLTTEMRSEIEKIIPRERDELVEWAANEYVRRAGLPQYKRERRRG
jgi:hypothetical protein